MCLVFDKRLCIYRQIGGLRIEEKVTEADVRAALQRLDRAGVPVEDIQAVLGITMADWGQEEYQRVAGVAYAFSRRRLSRKAFGIFAENVRRDFVGKPDRWMLDVSPMDILRLERPLSFALGHRSEDEPDDLDERRHT
jgi:hypothetical protein